MVGVILALERTFIGLAFLALQHERFPARRAMHVYDGVERPAIAYLDTTFGKSTRGPRAYFNAIKDRPHWFQVYLTNGCCIRNGNCCRGEVGYSKRKIVERPRRIRKLVERYGNENTRAVVSVALEDNLSHEKRAEIVTAIRRVWPWGVSINPMGVRFTGFDGADYFEAHGRNVLLPADGGVLSLDGVDTAFRHRRAVLPQYLNEQELAGVLKRYPHAEARFLWTAPSQGLRQDATRDVCPRKRTPLLPWADVRALNRVLKKVQ